MANAKPKPDKGKNGYNTERHNRKAWKKRTCGKRHNPVPCRDCKIVKPGVYAA